MNEILSLGIILLLGFVGSKLIRYIKMPSITAYLIVGILIGPMSLGLISKNIVNYSGMISNIVLSFVAFSIGQNFSKERFREIGKSALWLSFAESLGAAIVVGTVLYFFTKLPFFMVVSFAAIAPATAPAAVIMVVREFKARGKFTNTLLSVVALDDTWGLMIFALLLAIVKNLSGVHSNIYSIAASGLLHGMIEIIGSVVFGLAVGMVFSYFSKYLTTGVQILIYTLGFIVFNAGASLILGISVLLSNMAMATLLVNVNKTSFRFFNALGEVDTPFYVLFFVLAGAHLDLGVVGTMGVIGALYIFARMAGKILGVFIGSSFVVADKDVRKYLGMGLAPQAGVALGMAMIVKHIFPEQGGLIVSTIVATTVIYEVFGPILTKYALQITGDIDRVS